MRRALPSIILLLAGLLANAQGKYQLTYSAALRAQNSYGGEDCSKLPSSLAIISKWALNGTTISGSVYLDSYGGTISHTGTTSGSLGIACFSSSSTFSCDISRLAYGKLYTLMDQPPLSSGSIFMVGGSLGVGISPPSPNRVKVGDSDISSELEGKTVALSIISSDDYNANNPISNFTYELQYNINGSSWVSVPNGSALALGTTTTFKLPSVPAGLNSYTLNFRARVHRINETASISYSPWSSTNFITVYKIPTIVITPSPSSPYCLTTENDKQITFSVSQLPPGYSLVLYYNTTYGGATVQKNFLFFCDDDQNVNCYSIKGDGTYTTRQAYGPGVYNIRAIVNSNWDTPLATLTLDKPTAAITVDEASGLSASDGKICNGAGVTLTASAGSSYSWAGGGQNSRAITVNPSASTTYSVTVTNANGCSASASKDIIVNALPSPTISGPAIACQGVSGNVYSTEPGMSGYSWALEGGSSTAGGTASNNSVTVTWNTPGTGKVKVNYTNGNGCTATAPKINDITVNPKPAITLGAMPSVCYGSTNAILPYSATTGNPDRFSIDFSNGISDIADATLAANQMSISLPNSLAVGVYNGTLSVKNSSTGCISGNYTISVTVKELPNPNIDGLLAACSGSSGNIYTTDLGMTGYIWTVDGGTISAGGGTASNSVTVTWGAAGIGHVKVNYTSGNGCRAAVQKDKSITVNPLPNTSFLLGDPIICFGKPATVIQSGGENGVSYQLRIASGNVGDPIGGNGLSFTYPSVSPALTTEYSVLAKIEATGCSDILIDKAVVKVNPLPLPTFTSGPTIACANVAGNVYATQPGMSNYQWSVIDGTITSGGTATSSSATITWNAAMNGTVTINYNDANGCTAETPTSSEVTISNLRFDLPVLTHLKCNGDKGGAIKIVARGGITPYTYLLKHGNTIVETNDNGEFKNLDAAPNYRVIVTDSNSCTIESDDIGINQPPVLVIESLGLTHVNCRGFSTGAIVPTITGRTNQQLTYLWSGPDGYTSADRNISGLKAGLYTLKVSDANGCSATLDSTIKQPLENLRASTPVVTDIDCHGSYTGRISITASGGTLPYHFTLRGGGIVPVTSTSGIFDGLPAAANYSITVTDKNLCTSTIDNITITQPANPFIFSISSSMNVTCPEGSNGQVNLKAEGGTPFAGNGYLYSMDGITWNPSAGTYRFDALAARLDTFRVKDSKGCQLSLIHEVTQPNEIKPNAVITNVTCKDDHDGKLSFAVTGGTSPYKLSITGPSSFSHTAVDVSQMVNLTDLSVGDYTLNLMDNAGCPSTSIHTVTKPESALQLTVRSSIKPSCSGRSDGEVKVKASGGWGGYSYRLLSNGTPGTDSIFRGLPKGNYLFETSDLLGCKAIANLQLNQPDTLKIAIKKITNLTCNSNGTGRIEVKTKGGTKDYRYSFRLGATQLANSIDSVFTNLTAADSYWVKAMDNHGCTDSVKAVVTQPEKLTINISNRHSNGHTINCPGKKDTIWVKPLGGTANYTLTPRSGPNAGYHPKGFALFDKPNGDYIFTIIDANGCFKTDTAKISNLPAPKIKGITITDARCANTTDGQITIKPWSATGFEKISWYAIGERDTVLIKRSADTFVNGILGGRYISMVTDTLTCTHDTTITVGAPPAIDIALDKRRDPKCFGNADGNLSVIASGRNPSDFKYVWYNQNQVKVSEVDSTGAIPSGSYSVVVTDLIGCSKTATHTIVDPKSLQPNMPSLVTICANQSYLADAGVPGNTFIWSSGDRFSASGRTVTLTEAGVYTVMVTDSKGCSGKGTLTLEKTNEIINANFMMADRVSVGDTLVLIEMSWPIPEAILWHYPSTFKPVYSNDYSIYLVPQKEGVDSIGLTSQVGVCWEMIYKKITVELAKDRGDKSIEKQPLIHEVAAFPNPNRGDFSVKVDLNQVADVLVEVYSVYGNRLFFKHESGLISYKMNINLFQPPGIYLVRIASGNEHRSLRVVVE